MEEVDFKAQQNSEEFQQEKTVPVEDDVVETVEIENVEETAEETVDEAADDAEKTEKTEDTEDTAETEFNEKESAKRLEAIEEKRSIVDLNADKHRHQRDEYHVLSREWKAKRDSLNAQVRDFVTEAGKCRDLRDQLNEQVRASKATRDEWNVKVSELKAKMTELRPERSDDKEKSGQSLEEMKKTLRRLEIEQQTKTMNKDAEDKLVKEISTLAKNIEERQSEVDSSLEQNSEYKAVYTEFKEAKAQAESFHSVMTDSADKAQAEHEKMIGLYDQADRIRKEADAAQAKHMEYRRLGDEEHKKHIELVGTIHEADKEAMSIKNRKSNVRKKKAEAENKKEAKEIFERFKSGDKLSTDDLMALQRSGYL